MRWTWIEIQIFGLSQLTLSHQTFSAQQLIFTEFHFAVYKDIKKLVTFEVAFCKVASRIFGKFRESKSSTKLLKSWFDGFDEIFFHAEISQDEIENSFLSCSSFTICILAIVFDFTEKIHQFESSFLINTWVTCSQCGKTKKKKLLPRKFFFPSKQFRVNFFSKKLIWRNFCEELWH